MFNIYGEASSMMPHFTNLKSISIVVALILSGWLSTQCSNEPRANRFANNSKEVQKAPVENIEKTEQGAAQTTNENASTGANSSEVETIEDEASNGDPSPSPEANATADPQQSSQPETSSCPTEVSWGNGCGQKIDELLFTSTQIGNNGSTPSFKNTNAGFEGSAAFQCNEGQWVFKDGTCNVSMPLMSPSPQPTNTPCTSVGVSEKIVKIGLYSNCIGGQIPRTNITEKSEFVLTHYGCCARVQSKCMVTGLSNQNTITCIE